MRRLFLVIVGLGLCAGASGAQAQTVRVLDEEEKRAASSAVFRSSAAPRPRSGPSSQDRFGAALAGSSIGVTVGVSVGALLLAGAAQYEDDDRTYETSDDERGPAATMELFGVLAVLSGGPIGAVEQAGIERGRAGSYAVSVLGELMLGGIGYAAGRQVHDNAVLSGLWALPGMVVGSAAGASMGAPEGKTGVAILGRPDPESRQTAGAITVEEGRWALGVPNIEVQWVQHPEGERMAVRVALLNVPL